MSRYRADIYEEVFYEITLFDQGVLYTPLRCDPYTLPRGLYLYELRHDDEGFGIPCELAKHVAVNFCGTVISDCEITLNKTYANGTPYAEIDPDEMPVLDGYAITVSEYLLYHPPDTG